MKRPSNVLWLTLLATLLLGSVAVAAEIDALSATFTAPNDRGAQLRITGPKGFVFEHTLKAGEVFSFSPFDADGKLLADGLYRWNVAALSPTAPVSNRTSLVSDAKRGLDKAGLGRAEPQWGYFTLSGGYFVTPAVEESADKDQVILDDLIVDGSACVGFDCVNGESFGFDTLRLKENNVRIKFDDTSNSGSFPFVDWQLTANDSANGGANKFSIDDITNGRTPFTVEAGAPSHSLYVDDGGRIGMGTSTPVVQLHVVDGNTPTLRLEQDGSSGFTAQTWDVAGNEANFFVRDATNGSTLPLRIKPGAPTNAISIDNDGDVGMGVQSPGTLHNGANASVHIRRTDGESSLLIEEASGTVNNGRFQMELRNNGNANFALKDNNTGDRWDFAAASAFRISKQGTQVSEMTIFSGGNVTIAGALTTAGPTCSGAGGCDGVFSDEYEVESIEAHAAEMWQRGYLPAVGPTLPKAPVNLSEQTGNILNELEKAHIYIEQLNDQLKEKASEVDDLKARLTRLEALIDQQ